MYTGWSLSPAFCIGTGLDMNITRIICGARFYGNWYWTNSDPQWDRTGPSVPATVVYLRRCSHTLEWGGTQTFSVEPKKTEKYIVTPLICVINGSLSILKLYPMSNLREYLNLTAAIEMIQLNHWKLIWYKGIFGYPFFAVIYFHRFSLQFMNLFQFVQMLIFFDWISAIHATLNHKGR